MATGNMTEFQAFIDGHLINNGVFIGVKIYTTAGMYNVIIHFTVKSHKCSNGSQKNYQ